MSEEDEDIDMDAVEDPGDLDADEAKADDDVEGEGDEALEGVDDEGLDIDEEIPDDLFAAVWGDPAEGEEETKEEQAQAQAQQAQVLQKQQVREELTAEALNSAEREFKEREKDILVRMGPEQYDRYRKFSDTSLSAPRIKQMIQAVTGPHIKVSAMTVAAMSTVTKMFIGDLVEESRALMAQRGETGPIRPAFLREALENLTVRDVLLAHGGVRRPASASGGTPAEPGPPGSVSGSLTPDSSGLGLNSGPGPLSSSQISVSGSGIVSGPGLLAASASTSTRAQTKKHLCAGFQHEPRFKRL